MSRSSRARRGQPRGSEVRQERQEPRDTRTSRLWWMLAAIVVAGSLVYVNSLANPFIFDDELSVVDNRSLSEEGLTSALFPERDTPVAGRPVVNLSFALNYALGGVDVRGYRIWNIAVHLACALLLFGVVHRTCRQYVWREGTLWSPAPVAFAAALIWTLHPLNTEVIDYVTQRTESMMALCLLLTMYAAIRAWGPERRGMWEAVAVGSSAAGMLCKESMVVAPLLVVLYDRLLVVPSWSEALRARRRLYVGLALTWVVLAVILWTTPRGQSAGFGSGVTAWDYLLNQAVMIVRYLRLAVWPDALVTVYGWPVELTFGDVLPEMLLIAVALGLTIYALVRRPVLGFLGLWFFITLAPTSSIVPIATEVGAERRMYLPLMALAILAVVAAMALLARVRRTDGTPSSAWPSRSLHLAGAIVLAAVAAGLALTTVARNREYRSSLALMETIVARWPSPVTRHMLGTRLLADGRNEDALVHLRASASGAPRAHLDSGIALFNLGRYDEAVSELSALIGVWESPPATHPYWQPPLTLEAISARVFIARSRMKQERWSDAVGQLNAVLASEPADAEARGLLAEALFGQGRFADAAAAYGRALALSPNNVDMMTNMAVALDLSGQPDAAVGVFRRIVEVEPQNGQARYNLATILLERGNIAEAVRQAQQATTLRGDASSYNLFGRALAFAGRLDEAEKQFQQALTLDPGNAAASENLRAVAGGRR